MGREVAREIITGIIGVLVLFGCAFLIYQGRGSEEQAWLMAGVVITYFFSRQTQASTVGEVLRSQPTVNASAGPPPQVQVEPGRDE